MKLKASILAVIVFFLIHTLLVVQGYTSYLYERFSDVIVITVFLGLFIYTIRNLPKKNVVYHLVIANLFLMILVTHVLRLYYGGLLC